MMLSFISGLLLYGAFPPLNAWPLLFLALTLFFISLYKAIRPLRLLGGTLLFMVGFSPVSLFLPDPILVSMTVTTFTAVLFVGLVLVRRFSSHPAVFWVSLPLLFSAADYAKAAFSFLPPFITSIGIPLAGTPFMGVARLGGLSAETFFVAAASTAFAYAVCNFQDRRATLTGLAMGMGVICLGLLSFLTLPEKTPLPFKVMTVSVGENFTRGSSSYDTPEFLQRPDAMSVIETYVKGKLAPIGEAVDRERPEVVVLPQSMFEELVLKNLADTSAAASVGVTSAGPILKVLAEFAASHHVYVLDTLLTFDLEGEKRESTVSIDLNGNFTGRIDKKYLSIGVDYWPFGNSVPGYIRKRIESLPPAERALSFITYSSTGQQVAGRGPRTFLVDGVRVAVPICLEGHLPWVYAQAKQEGANLIFHSNSYSWAWSGLARTSLETMTMKLRQIEAVYHDIPIVVSIRAGKPGVVFQDGSTINAAEPPQDSWTYLIR